MPLSVLRQLRTPPAWLIAALPWILGALALGLRLWRLGEWELCNDEASDMIRTPWTEVWFGAESRFNPPPQRLLNNLVYQFTFEPFWMRLGPALFGSAAVSLLFLAARAIAPTGVAFAAGLLLCVSPLHIYVSQLQRAYALLTCAGAASLWAVARILASEEREPTPGQWWHLGIALAATVWAHLLGGFILALCLLAVLARQWQRKGSLLGPVLVGAALVAACAPLLLWANTGVEEKVSQTLAQAAAWDWLLLFTGDGKSWWLQGLTVLAIVLCRGPARWMAVLCLAQIAVMVLVVQALSERMVVIPDRYVSGVLPMSCLGAALCLCAHIDKLRWGAVLLIALTLNKSVDGTREVLGAGPDEQSRYAQRPEVYKRIAATVHAELEREPGAQKGAIIVLAPGYHDSTLAWYLVRAPLSHGCEALSGAEAGGCPGRSCTRCDDFVLVDPERDPRVDAWLSEAVSQGQRPVFYSIAPEGDGPRQAYQRWIQSALQPIDCQRLLDTPRAFLMRCRPARQG